MKKGFTVLIPAIILLSGQTLSKKEQLLQLSKKYFPENFVVLKEYDEAAINSQANGDSLHEFITDVSTIVHEGYHRYKGNHSSYYDASVVYRLNDTLSIPVKNFETFPAREIDNIVPDATRKKIFRYDTYISNKDKYLVTQQYGILGLMEECIAYYQSFSTEILLYNYYKDQHGWKDPDIWITYLSNMASYRYSIFEFELFISWYMQVARKKHIKTYRDIVSNAGLKKLFVFLESENKRLSILYDQHRSVIMKQFVTHVQLKDNFLYNTKSHTGKGLYDKEVIAMDALLKDPTHKILDELRK
ncbi:MAG: hypothetical protein ACRDEB_00255 [Chitinophagaceae bacterium]